MTLLAGTFTLAGLLLYLVGRKIVQERLFAGLFLMTLATPGSAWTIVSPLIVTVVLLKMTGVPLTEKHIARTRPGYADYVRRTNAFIPGLPRKGTT